jgi:hypothetical protein
MRPVDPRKQALPAAFSGPLPHAGPPAQGMFVPAPAGGGGGGGGSAGGGAMPSSAAPPPPLPPAPRVAAAIVDLRGLAPAQPAPPPSDPRAKHQQQHQQQQQQQQQRLPPPPPLPPQQHSAFGHVLGLPEYLPPPPQDPPPPPRSSAGGGAGGGGAGGGADGSAAIALAPNISAVAGAKKTIGQALIEAFGPLCLKYHVLKEGANPATGGGSKKGKNKNKGSGGGSGGGGNRAEVCVSFHAPGRPGNGTIATRSAPHEREARVLAQWDVARKLEAAGAFKIPQGLIAPGDKAATAPAVTGGGKRARPPDFQGDTAATAAYARRAAAEERHLKEYEAQLLGEDSL